jgi:hypothetical protein
VIADNNEKHAVRNRSAPFSRDHTNQDRNRLIFAENTAITWEMFKKVAGNSPRAFSLQFEPDAEISFDGMPA